jgi:hypothetical protein
MAGFRFRWLGDRGCEVVQATHRPAGSRQRRGHRSRQRRRSRVDAQRTHGHGRGGRHGVSARSSRGGWTAVRSRCAGHQGRPGGVHARRGLGRRRRPPDIQFARANATADAVSLEVCDVFRNEPGYTNTTLSHRRARAWAKRRRVSRSQPTLSTGQSAPLLLAQALHKRAAARTWLPLRTIWGSHAVDLIERAETAASSSVPGGNSRLVFASAPAGSLAAILQAWRVRPRSVPRIPGPAANTERMLVAESESGCRVECEGLGVDSRESGSPPCRRMARDFRLAWGRSSCRDRAQRTVVERSSTATGERLL